METIATVFTASSLQSLSEMINTAIGGVITEFKDGDYTAQEVVALQIFKTDKGYDALVVFRVRELCLLRQTD